MTIFNRKKKKEQVPLDNKRYQEKPMNLFFEYFILDILEQLPKEKSDYINNMNLAKVFKTEPKDWRLIIKEVLNLSNTIEIAIFDLWYKNREIAKNKGIDYSGVQFAMDFVDNFYKIDSKIDVWEGDSFFLAKDRVKKFKENNE